MLKKEGIIEKSEMLSVKPQEYLSNGFLQSDGQVREGINGEYSLAMAYRLKEEGITSDNIGQVIEKLYQIAGSEAQDDPNKKLSSTALDAIKQLSKSSEVSKSNAINELFGAAGSLVNDWKNLAAFIVHLERIQAQIALLSELPKIKR
jgi:hypothetical protein